MSGQANRQDGDTAAAVGFGAILALAAGGAGLVIAALAVGIERAWSRRNGGRSLRDARRRDRYGDALAWLAQDRARRDTYRQRRREWWRSGATGEPPAAPSVWDRLGAWLRRRVAKAYVGAHDFRAGFRDGWQAAQETRRTGARFRDVARSRPAQDDDDANACPKCGGLKEEWERLCPACELAADSEPGPTADPEPEPPTHAPDPPAQAGDPDAIPDNQPKPSDPLTGDGEPTMTSPQGDTNATVMLGHLAGIKDQLKVLDDLNDQLSTQRDALAQKVQEATEFAEQTGQTSQTRQALDAAGGVATQLGQQVGAVSESVTEADDQTDSAVDGLRPVQHAEDELTTAGADGRAVAPAGAGA